MFEPRVPGFVHIPTCYPYRQERRQARRDGGPDRGAPARGGDPARGAGHGGRLHRRADPRRRRRDLSRPTTTSRSCAQVCDRHDVLFIADEVITGFCRTGKWFALEHWNVKPDIMSFAKGVTSGYLPLGGIMVSQGDQGRHGRREAGRPLDARLHLLGASRRAARSRSRTSRSWSASGSGSAPPRWASGCTTACSRLRRPPHVGDIRGGKGLLAAVELVEDKATKKNFAADKKVAPRVLQEMTKRGVMTRAPARAHLLLAAAGDHRGGGRPAGLGHPRRRQGGHRRLASLEGREGGAAPLPARY